MLHAPRPKLTHFFSLFQHCLLSSLASVPFFCIGVIKIVAVLHLENSITCTNNKSRVFERFIQVRVYFFCILEKFMGLFSCHFRANGGPFVLVTK